MVQPLSACIKDALATNTNNPGMCLQQVQTWYKIPASQPHASAAWRATRLHRAHDRRAPRGAPVWWTGGRHGFGHIAMSLGNGTIRSTDAGGSGRVATVALEWVERRWGLTYEGWSADLEGVVIPELKALIGPSHASAWTGGDVYVSKLHYGQPDSDSVPRLQQALNVISLPAPGNITLAVTGNYDDPTDIVVRAWQRHIANTPDPAKGSSVGPQQAATLFAQPPFLLH